MANQITEELFRSIDAIIQARLEKLQYDYTIKAKIIDNSNKDYGQYSINYKGTILTAYSSIKDLEINDMVYVLVLNGDFNGEKIIISKIIETQDETAILKPFETYVPVIDLFNKKEEAKIFINSDVKENLLGNYTISLKDLINYTGFTRLGLSFNILANLYNEKYTVVAGTYGIDIIITGWDQSSLIDTNDYSAMTTRTFSFTIEDMIAGDLYATSGYIGQEKVFSLANFIPYNIKIILKQDANFKTLDQNLIPTDNFLPIFVNDISLTLGYEGTKSQYINGKVFPFTSEGLLYTAANNKKIYTRLVYCINEVIYSFVDTTSRIHGAHYTLYKKHINENIYDQVEVASSFPYFILSDFNVKGAEEETYKVAMSFSKYNSQLGITQQFASEGIITLTNSNYVKNANILDSLTGFTITPKYEDDTGGVFNIYGQDGKLLNQAESFKTHYLELKYNGVSDDRQLAIGDKIEWSFPTNSTMIHPVSGMGLVGSLELTSSNLIVNQNNNTTSYLFAYEISDIYNQNYTNNTINFTLVQKQNNMTKRLSNSIELFFGTSGYSGSDYTFALELQYRQKKVCGILLGNNINDYTIKPFFYDYNMKKINITEDERIKYYLKDEEKNKNEILKEVLSLDEKDYWDRIIYAEYELNNKKYIAYLPITVFSKGIPTDAYIAGCTTITYDIAGKNPNYYKQQYQLFDKNGKEYKNLQWKLDSNDKYDFTLVGNIITPSSIYKEGLKLGIRGIKIDGDNSVCVYQPIVILQNQYPQAMNIIDKEARTTIGNDKIQNVIAGKLTTPDTGLVLGDLELGQTKQIGIYAYNNKVKTISITPNEALIKNAVINFKDGVGDRKQPIYIDTNGQIKPIDPLSSLTVGSANSLNLSDQIGGINNPIYFNNFGVPLACTPYNLATVKTAIYPDISPASLADRESIASRLLALERRVQDLENNAV